jgi:hypothetical protein
MIPVDTKLFYDIVAIVKARNPTYIPANGNIPNPIATYPDVMVETRTDEEKAQI